MLMVIISEWKIKTNKQTKKTKHKTVQKREDGTRE